MRHLCKEETEKSGSFSVHVFDNSSDCFVVFQIVGRSLYPIGVNFIMDNAKRGILECGNQTIIPFFEQEEPGWKDFR